MMIDAGRPGAHSNNEEASRDSGRSLPQAFAQTPKSTVLAMNVLIDTLV